MKIAWAAIFLLAALGANATTNELSDAEIQGRALAQKMLAQLKQRPAENSSNTGFLEIKSAKGDRLQIPFSFKIIVTATNWETIYEAKTTNGVEKLLIAQGLGQSSHLSYNSPTPLSIFGGTSLFDHSFASSDFSVGDLDLDFLGWPEQKILPNPTTLKRGRSYTLLETINPNPSTNDYSRVLLWIDKETDGILEAEAYDAQGKLLKIFEPKEFKKVNGQWELQEMEISNLQTGSRTRLEFDVKNQ